MGLIFDVARWRENIKFNFRRQASHDTNSFDDFPQRLSSSLRGIVNEILIKLPRSLEKLSLVTLVINDVNEVTSCHRNQPS